MLYVIVVVDKLGRTYRAASANSAEKSLRHLENFLHVKKIQPKWIERYLVPGRSMPLVIDRNTVKRW